MARANTIARCHASLVDGTELGYSDSEEAHIKQHRFAAILAANPLSFTAETVDGASFSVDLVDGSLTAAGQRFETEPQATPLRLVYFKRMMGTASTGPILRPSDRDHPKPQTPVCQYFVVGWQTTTLDGRNVRVGLKVFPAEARWEVTDEW